MSTNGSTGNIAKALSTARDRCRPAEKDSLNRYHQYAYASAEEIIKVANEALEKTELALISLSDEMRQGPSGPLLDRTWILCHSSGESVRLTTIGWPVIPDKGRPLDKALAAAITTSLAYRLRDLLQIPRVSPEDDIASRDDRHHERNNHERPAEPRATAEQCITIRALLRQFNPPKKEADAVAYAGGQDVLESLAKDAAERLKAMLAAKAPALKTTLEQIDAKMSELGIKQADLMEWIRTDGKIDDPLAMTQAQAEWVLANMDKKPVQPASEEAPW